MSGHLIPLRKNAEILDRRYRVYTQNFVETKDIENVNGRIIDCTNGAHLIGYKLSNVDTTEAVEGTEEPENMETTEGTDVQGSVFCV